MGGGELLHGLQSKPNNPNPGQPCSLITVGANSSYIAAYECRVHPADGDTVSSRVGEITARMREKFGSDNMTLVAMACAIKAFRNNAVVLSNDTGAIQLASNPNSDNKIVKLIYRAIDAHKVKVAFQYASQPQLMDLLLRNDRKEYANAKKSLIDKHKIHSFRATQDYSFDNGDYGQLELWLDNINRPAPKAESPEEVAAREAQEQKERAQQQQKYEAWKKEFATQRKAQGLPPPTEEECQQEAMKLAKQDMAQASKMMGGMLGMGGSMGGSMMGGEAFGMQGFGMGFSQMPPNMGNMQQMPPNMGNMQQMPGFGPSHYPAAGMGGGNMQMPFASNMGAFGQMPGNLQRPGTGRGNFHNF